MSSFSGTVAVFSGGGTGGHLYPALALAEALRELRPDVRPFFVGARRGVEARVLPQRAVDHLLLPVRGFSRRSLLENLGVLGSLFRSLLQTAEAFARLRPGMVVVTGGYAGGPAGLVAGLMGIPLALQEQNAHPGLTTRVLSRWSLQIHLAFPEARELLPPRARARATVSGNPVRPPAPEDAATARQAFGIAADARVLLVVGGSQGAATLNRAVLDVVRDLATGSMDRPADLEILWGTGPEHLEGVRDALVTLGVPSWVKVHGYIDEMPLALKAATMAVSRAGASATSEFLAAGLPAILVPLPTAAADHQARNAESLCRAGAAHIIREDRLSADRLWRLVTESLDDKEGLATMRKTARDLGRPQATREIATRLATLIPNPAGGRP